MYKLQAQTSIGEKILASLYSFNFIVTKTKTHIYKSLLRVLLMVGRVGQTAVTAGWEGFVRGDR